MGNEDIVCIGVCINDPETGVCLGCGRQPEAVSGGGGETRHATERLHGDSKGAPSGHPAGTSSGRPTGTSFGHKKNDGTPLSAAEYPLPPQVMQELDTPSD